MYTCAIQYWLNDFYQQHGEKQKSLRHNYGWWHRE